MRRGESLAAHWCRVVCASSPRASALASARVHLGASRVVAPSLRWGSHVALRGACVGSARARAGGVQHRADDGGGAVMWGRDERDNRRHEWELFGHRGIACRACGTVIYQQDSGAFVVHRWGAEYSATADDPVPVCETRPRAVSGVHQVPATVEALRERALCPDHGVRVARGCDGCVVAQGWRRRFEHLARVWDASTRDEHGPDYA